MNLDELDCQIIREVQSNFPVTSRPFAALGERLGRDEAEVLARIRRLQDNGVIREIGPVFDLRRLGYISTLCAAKVEPAALDAVVAVINRFPEVTHNYLREHALNVWFTLVADSQERIAAVLDAVRHTDGVVGLFSLPAERVFKIRVRFEAPGNTS